MKIEHAIFATVITLSGIIPATAQQQSPNEQALGTKLLQELQAGLGCNANLLSVQADLTKANAEIKIMKEKYEPKKPEEKK